MNIADKIKKRRDELGWSQQKLAEMCGWGQSRISGYETGEKVPPLKSIKILEKALNVPSGYLTIDEEDHHVSNILQLNETSAIYQGIAKPQDVVKIPAWKRLHAWSEAHRWDELMEEIAQDTARPIIPIGDEFNKDCFPLKIEKDSMSPRFKLGDYIIVDPHKKPSFGSFVVARNLDSNENLFGQYFEQDNEASLSFTNKVYPKITKPSEKMKIIGVVVRKLISEDIL